MLIKQNLARNATQARTIVKTSAEDTQIVKSLLTVNYTIRPRDRRYGLPRGIFLLVLTRPTRPITPTLRQQHMRRRRAYSTPLRIVVAATSRQLSRLTTLASLCLRCSRIWDVLPTHTTQRLGMRRLLLDGHPMVPTRTLHRQLVSHPLAIT